MELLELGKLPISPDAPAGKDVKYESDYEELQAEIDKLSMPTTKGDGINWRRVVQLGSTILAEQSKNLLVSTYLAAGLVETQQTDGLVTGLTILKDLVENFWDSMYPSKKRLRGRINAFEWWINRTEAHFNNHPPKPQPAEKVKAIRASLEALDQVLSAKMESAPMVSRLLECVQHWPIQVKQEAAPEPQAQPDQAPSSAAPPSSQPQPRTQPVAPVAEISSAQDADQLLAHELKQLVKIADHLMQQDPANPMAYQLIRIGAWLTLDRLPLAENNQTRIPPPDSSVRTSIEQLFQNRDFQAAVVESESKIREYLFWMDLCRLSSDSLDRLGEKYSLAQETVCTYTALFVKRFPKIEQLSFADGTPFADTQTRAWLKSISLDGGQQNPLLTGGPEGSQGGLELSQTLAEGMKRIKENKLGEAVALFQGHLTGGSSGKSRLSWRVALTHLLIQAGQLELARPHLDELLRQIEAYRLEEWDPDMAVNALQVVYQGFLAADETKPQAEEIFDRIARISPTAALAYLES